MIIDVASEGALAPLGNALIMAGVSQLAGYAISLLASQHRPPLLPVGAMYAGTLEPPAKTPETIEEAAATYLADDE